MKVDEQKLEDISVVRNFPGVFLENLSGLPPILRSGVSHRSYSGAMPVVKSPYRLAPTEMKELLNQLKELKDKVTLPETYSDAIHFWGCYTFGSELTPAYTTLSNPQGVIYDDNLKQKRFMGADELYKFSNGTLVSVRDTLSQMLHDLHLGYNKTMRRRQWTILD
ncbi:hypothetical protein Tco_0256713 [Tanacetum coccineum]